MNHLDLFSGIGGFSLGLKKVFDIKETYFSEIDKYAIDVYKHNFKNSKYVGSITDVRGTQLPRINIITFGSPCQDFSLAGKRKGMDGARSSLILEAIRLVKECKPDFFIWENVKGTFSSNSGADFTAIIKAFNDIGGYRLEWQLLNTKWFLPQNRERIYLVGCLGEGSGRQIFPITESSRKINDIQRQQGNTCTLTTRYGDAGGNGSYIVERELDAQKTIDKTIVHDIPEIVRKRKYDINTEELRAFLRKHKTKSIKQISKEMNLPYSQVEHWFRNSDKWFSIPPAEIWFKLKNILNIKETKYDKAITTFIEVPGTYEKTNRVYDSQGIAPTLTKTAGDERIIVGDFRNDEGFRPRKDGDSPCLASRRNSEKDISTMPPLIKSDFKINKTKYGKHQQDAIYETNKSISPTLMSGGDGHMGGAAAGYLKFQVGSKIRRLTPIECERLQGFPDNWTKIGKELGGISDSQRYKMCGNAVTVDVVKKVAERIKNVI